MSSQVKKRFAEMTAYLGRDTKGLEHLKRLRDDVNVLRKNLAAAVQLADDEAQVKIAARERADAMAAELVQLRRELHSARQRSDRLQHELSSVLAAHAEAAAAAAEAEAAAVAAAGESIDTPLDIKCTGLEYLEGARQALKALKKIKRRCPEPFTMMPDVSADYARFDREDIAAGWTHQDLWTLGATVAVLIMVDGQAIITTHRNNYPEDPAVLPHFVTFVRATLRWIGYTDKQIARSLKAIEINAASRRSAKKLIEVCGKPGDSVDGFVLARRAAEHLAEQAELNAQIAALEPH